MKKITKNWIATADYDWTTAEHMFQSGRFLYVIYMCHLSLEKLLKAVVAENQDPLPPRTHNLYHLIQLIGLKVPENFKKLFADLNAMSLPVRYPEDLEQLSMQYDKKVAEDYLKQTKECIQWLKQHPMLQEY